MTFPNFPFWKKKPSEEKAHEPPPEPPRAPRIIPRIALVEELRGTLEKTCYAHGHGVARKSGRRTPDQAILKALEALAESKALAIAKAQSEAMAENLLRRWKEMEAIREQRILDRDAAANKHNAARQVLAATPAPGAYPELPQLFVYTVTVWLTASLSPSMHDLLTGLDSQMKWMVGIATSFGISTAMVYGILPSTQSDLGAPTKEARHRGTVIAGLLLGVGFFVLRLSASRSYGDMLFAAALALMEFGAVVLVERNAKPLFAEVQAWRDRVNVRRLAEAGVIAEKQRFDERQTLVDQVELQIEEVEDGLERAHAGSDAKALVTIAVNAIRAGYFEGISGNAADLGGVA